MELVPIPEGLKKRDNDYVSYTATDADGGKVDRDHICYASHMPMLSKHSFDLLPYRKQDDWKKYAIDGATYLRFIDLFKDHGVVHGTVRAEVDAAGVPRMHIPRGLSRHRVFAAMCCYRWAESMPAFPYLIVKLAEEREELSFWQILHYVMSTQVTGTGHNWCDIGITNMVHGYVYLNAGMAYNLGLSLAFPFLWSKGEEEMLPDTGTTCYTVSNLASQIAPNTPAKNRMTMPSLVVCGSWDKKPFANDVLNPVWTPLYKLAESYAVGDWTNRLDRIKAGLLGMYTEILKTHEPGRAIRELLEKPKTGKTGSYDW